jgi:hypothetical protein
VEQPDLERIARLALRELGADTGNVTVARDRQEDRWRITVGGHTPTTLVIRAGRGTTPQFVREQIFEQFQRR